MVIKSLKIEGYGELNKLTIHFNSGFNMIFGANESGKSTLTRCIAALLYGQSSLDRKGIKEKEIMRPWDGSNYRASMVYELKNKGKFRIYRDFENEKVTVTHLDTGKEITDSFSRDSNGEPGFAKEHLGIDNKCFSSTGFILQNEMSKLENGGKISNRIMSIVDQSESNISYMESTVRLKNLREEIGSEEVPWTPLGELALSVSSRESSLNEMENKQREVARLEEDRGKLQQELKDIEKEFKKLLYTRSKLELKKNQSVLDRVRQLEEEIPKTQYKIERTMRYGYITIEGRSKLFSLKSEIDSLKKLFNDIDNNREAMMNEYRRTKDELNEKEKLLSIDEDILERFNIADVPREARSSIIETKTKMLNNSREKMEEIKKQYIKEADKFSGFRNAGEYNEKVSDLETKISKKEILEMKESELERLGGELKKLNSLIMSRVLISILVMTFGGFLSIYSFTRGIFDTTFSQITSDHILFGVGLGILIFGIIYWLSSLTIRKEKTLVRNNISKRNEEIKEIKDDVISAQIGLKELFTKIGVLSVDELRSKYREFNRLKIDMETTVNLVKALEKEILSLSGDYEESLELKQVIIDLNYIKPEDKITNEVMLRLKDDYRKAGALKKKVESMRERYENLADERNEYNSKIEKLKNEIKEILTEAQVDSPEVYDEALKNIRELERNKTHINSMMDKKRLLLGEKKVSDITKKIQRLERDLVFIEKENPDFITIDVTLVDPDTITDKVEELRPRQMDITSHLSVLETRIQTIKERYLNRDHSGEYEKLKKDFQNLKKHKKAIDIAIETIKIAGREFHEKYFNPAISSAMKDVLKKITGKYEDVVINEEMHLSVRSRNNEKPVEIESLSRGTIDQVYFALRLGIAGILSKENIHLPLVMDEPFNQFDQERRERTLEILLSPGFKRQVLMFTGRKEQKNELAHILKKEKRKASLVHLGAMELIKPV